MTKEDKQIIDRAIKESWRTGDRTRLKRLLEKNLKLYRENAELKEKLTAIRNAKDKYDMSKDKSIIKAFGAEYTLLCDLERILEEMEIF